MVELRRRVWKKIGWDCDGRGMDPWWGGLNGLIGSGEEETGPYNADRDKTNNGMPAPDQVVEAWTGEWNAAETTGLEELDSILAGDPMDMFQWEEWESLASEFFAS